MTIKEVSKRFNISADTLRYYEKIGVIRPVPKKNGIRNYGEKEIENIEFVMCMRGAGLSLECLAEYMKLIEAGDKTKPKRKELLIKQREELKEKIEEMNKAYEKLNYKIDIFYK